MPPAKLLVKSNEAGNCFVVAWLGSLTAFNASPLKMRFQRDLGRALSAVEIYGRTNILVLVYDDQKDRAIIWDEQQGQAVHTVTPPPLLNYGEILTCHFRQDYLVLIMSRGIAVYEVEHWRLVCHQRLESAAPDTSQGLEEPSRGMIVGRNRAQTTTEGNPYALGELVVKGQLLRLIYPAGDGQVAIRTFHLPAILAPNATEPLATEGGHHLIHAHHNSIAALALSPDGHWIATASLRGTVIRLWSTTPGATAAKAIGSATVGTGHSLSLLTPPFAELRRGLSLTNISGLAFGPGLLAVAGGTGTVHIYPLSFLKTTSSSCQVADPLGVSLSGDDNKSEKSKSSNSKWWRQIPGHAYIKEFSKAYIPQYLRNTGSQLQISASESCNILHINNHDIVLISPGGQYQKFGYRLGAGEGETAYWPLEAVQLASPAL